MADAAGLAFARTRSLNDDPRFLAMLADVVRAAAGPEPSSGPGPARPARPRPRAPAGVTARRRPVTVVVGGGIAGLAAAWELATGDRDRRAAARVAPPGGGATGSAASCAPPSSPGGTVDLAADAFLARRPEATELCDELGLTGALVAPGTAGASVWARGRLRPMPDGLNLGVPTRWWAARPVAASSARPSRCAWPKDLVVPHLGDPPTPSATGRSGDIVGDTPRHGRWSSAWSTRWSAGSTPAASTT